MVEFKKDSSGTFRGGRSYDARPTEASGGIRSNEEGKR